MSALFRVESPGSSIVVGIVEAKKYFYINEYNHWSLEKSEA